MGKENKWEENLSGKAGARAARGRALIQSPHVDFDAVYRVWLRQRFTEQGEMSCDKQSRSMIVGSYTGR